MLYPYGVAATMLLCAAQAIPLDGTWQLTRIFRAGTPVTTRAIPLDSTVYIRVSLESHTGGWISGRLYRRGGPARRYGALDHRRGDRAASVGTRPHGGVARRRYAAARDLARPRRRLARAQAREP